MKIWANTIVNNEENFLWFAVMSIANFVDKILIWDSGSTDKTVEVIKALQTKLGAKVKFKEVGKVDPEQFTKMRQKMLERSKADWILILDGDEIWWENSIKKLISEIKNKGNEVEGIVVPMVVPVGDIFHLQEELAGRYKILGKRGHISLKALSKNIPGLHVDWPYGKEGFFDGDGKLIQERENIIFLDAPILHVTHLKRSPERRQFEKIKIEIGNKVKEGFKFPEVLKKEYPPFISSPWIKLQGIKLLKAQLLTPLRKMKRKII